MTRDISAAGFAAPVNNLKEVYGDLVSGNINEIDEQFLKAASENNRKILKKCIRRGADVNCCRMLGQTALHIAAETGYSKIIKILGKQNNIKINQWCMFSKTPLMIAVEAGRRKAVKTLLLNNADPNKPNGIGKSPLQIAVFNKNFFLTKLLTQFGANVNAADLYGGTPLSVAILDSPCPEMAHLLLRFGASVEVVDACGLTLLTEAVLNATRQTHLDAIRLLIYYGASVNACEEVGGRTPLHMAVLTNTISVVKFLLEQGAELCLTDNAGWTPLKAAIAHKHLAVAKILSRHARRTGSVPEYEGFLLEKDEEHYTRLDED